MTQASTDGAIPLGFIAKVSATLFMAIFGAVLLAASSAPLVVTCGYLLAILVSFVTFLYFISIRNPERAIRRATIGCFLSLAAVALAYAVFAWKFTADLLGARVVIDASNAGSALTRVSAMAASCVFAWLAGLTYKEGRARALVAGEAPYETDRDLAGLRRPSTRRGVIKSSVREVREQLEIGLRELLDQYIVPDLRESSPADFSLSATIRESGRSAFSYVDDFLGIRKVERDGSNTLYILSDAGMGKTSFLAMLYLRLRIRRKRGAANESVIVRKLNQRTIDELMKRTPDDNLVVLLDSLDEDPVARKNPELRVQDINKISKMFSHVVVTCRTQFFPALGSVSPIEHKGSVRIGTNVAAARLMYLSPFTNSQIKGFLKKAVPGTFWQRVVEVLIGVPPIQRERADRLTRKMRGLRVRPMLLSRIDLLLEVDEKNITIAGLYSELVGGWLRREITKINATKKDLWKLWDACSRIAVSLHRRHEYALSSEEFSESGEVQSLMDSLGRFKFEGRSLLNRDTEGFWRFSHYSIQEFLVACFCARKMFPYSSLFGFEFAIEQERSFVGPTESERFVGEVPESPIEALGNDEYANLVTETELTSRFFQDVLLSSAGLGVDNLCVIGDSIVENVAVPDARRVVSSEPICRALRLIEVVNEAWRLPVALGVASRSVIPFKEVFSEFGPETIFECRWDGKLPFLDENRVVEADERMLLCLSSNSWHRQFSGDFNVEFSFVLGSMRDESCLLSVSASEIGRFVDNISTRFCFGDAGFSIQLGANLGLPEWGIESRKMLHRIEQSDMLPVRDLLLEEEGSLARFRLYFQEDSEDLVHYSDRGTEKAHEVTVAVSAIYARSLGATIRAIGRLGPRIDRRLR